MFDVVIDVSFIYLYFYILKCEIGHDLSHLIPENPLDRFNDTPMYGHARVNETHLYRMNARMGTWRHLSELQPLHNSMLSSTIAETNRPSHPGQVKMG